MLKSYAAVYKQGHLDWLDDAPNHDDNVQVIVTFIDTPQKIPNNQKQHILKQAWGCVKQAKTIFEEEQDISQPNQTTLNALKAAENGDYETVTLDSLRQQWDDS
jgi:hypothetical protein